jgi:hypothetical protein
MPWPLRTFFWSWRGRREVLNAQRAEGWNSAEHKQSIAVHSSPQHRASMNSHPWNKPMMLPKSTLQNNKGPTRQKKGDPCSAKIKLRSDWSTIDFLAFAVVAPTGHCGASSCNLNVLPSRVQMQFSLFPFSCCYIRSMLSQVGQYLISFGPVWLSWFAFSTLLLR